MPTLAPFEHLAAFRDEMRSAGANWELDIYGDARHSFTGEGIVNKTSPEAVLHPQSESRSWRATLEFLAEVLG
jgi:dienelactone hydrolase